MQPIKVSDLDMAFGAGDITKKLMPTWETIPKEFKNGHTTWNNLASQWFFMGLKGAFIPKPGIDISTAMGHLRSIMASFEPEHEHKEASVAYLMSMWFERFEPNEKRDA